eukprot:22699_1
MPTRYSIAFVYTFLVLDIYFSKASRIEIPIKTRVFQKNSLPDRKYKTLARFDHKFSDPFHVGFSADPAVPITNNGNAFLTAQVGIGTPKQEFELLLDTGSSDFWLVESGATVTGECPHSYNESASSTSRRMSNDTVTVKYMKGSVAGCKAEEVFHLGDATVKDQGFLQVNSVEDMDLTNMAGIWGMGFPGLASDHFETLIDNLFTQKQISERKFSFDLNSNRLIIGEPDKSLMKHSVVSVPILKINNTFAFWMTPLSSVAVGGRELCEHCGAAVIDSGTTLIGVPGMVWRSLVDKATSGRSDCGENPATPGIYTCRSTTSAGLNAVSFSISGEEFRFEPEDYVMTIKLEDGGLGLLLSFMNIGQGAIWIMGLPWLRKIYTVFDATDPANPSMTFAYMPVSHRGVWLALLVLLLAALVGAGAWMFVKWRARRRSQPLISGVPGRDSSAGYVRL